jgi:hypothetical protein
MSTPISRARFSQDASGMLVTIMILTAGYFSLIASDASSTAAAELRHYIHQDKIGPA